MAEPLDFLAAVDAPARAALEAAATRRGYPRDTVLFHGGDDGGTMIVLVSGQVKITVPTRRGRDTILGFSGPGELLGEISAVDGGPRSATATAIEPVEALGIPRSAFAGILAREPSMSRALLSVLAARLREADRQRAEYAGYDVLGRVSTHPRERSVVSALLVASREAPVHPASSCWEMASVISRPSGPGLPKRSASSTSRRATRPSTS